MNWKNFKIKPVYWGILIFVIAQAITFGVIIRQDAYFAEHEIVIPTQPEEVILWPTTTTTTTTGTTTNTATTTITTTISNEVITTTATQTQVTEVITIIEQETPVFSSLGAILIYFFAVVLVLAVVLFVIPLSALKILFRALFAFLFSWGIFIVQVFWMPLLPSIIIALAMGILWFFMPRIWLHNIIMILTMVSLGAVFGRLVSPWTAMILLLVIAVYDFLAVRFGFMTWMAKKMESSDSLPAFVIPHSIGEWKGSLKSPKNRNAVSVEIKNAPERFNHSILGGGDIGFPLLLTSAVYFALGFNSALLVAAFSLAGLICAYLIQSYIIKGKPMPALPPIAALSLVGLLLVI
ncbi:MAG: presenilin family intramembrane aspartyl protease [Dehalococcoidales bacterium]|nr:presenilin family intramembrane aspartyl protease [Dehalococcoidales bacterium]